jgi:hypothetical protein
MSNHIPELTESRLRRALADTLGALRRPLPAAVADRITALRDALRTEVPSFP